MTSPFSYPAGSWHSEIFTNPRTGVPIPIACDCPIGIDHRNADEVSLSASDPREEKSALQRVLPSLAHLIGRDNRQPH